MFTINVDPIAFTIGSLPIRWYGITTAVAILAVIAITFREAKKLGVTRDIYNLAIWAILGGLIGGRLAFVIYDWEYFVANPRAIIGFQGLAQNGMMIGVIVAALIYMGVTRMRFSTLLSMGDALAIGAPIGLAIGRVGCILNGCCTGTVAPDLPWAVVYTHPDSAAPIGTPVHPTNIYHLLWNLIAFALVWRFRGKFKPPGGLLFFYFCIHAVGDFVIRFLRTDDLLLWGLRQAQVIDLATLAIFLPWLIIRIRKFKETGPVTELASEAAQEQSHEN